MYEKLLLEAEKESIMVCEEIMPGTTKGLYGNSGDCHLIWVHNDMTGTEKCCVLAEEIGHYFTSTGNIIDLRDLRNRKQELRARKWAYNKLISIHRLVGAKLAGCEGRYEIADHLGVTIEFLEDSIQHYFQKHGKAFKYKQWMITFEPLDICENIVDYPC